MKLQEYINEMKPDFHKIYGSKYQFEAFQSDAHIDLTLAAATSYVQKLVLSGKMKEIQDLATQGSAALMESSHYKDLLKAVSDSFYGLDWTIDRKQELGKDVLGFILDGLKFKFQSGGYSMDQSGLMSFLGIDLGLVGKMGGMFSKFFR